jgi:hypothetical protein
MEFLVKAGRVRWLAMWQAGRSSPCHLAEPERAGQLCVTVALEFNIDQVGYGAADLHHLVSGGG